MPKSRSLVVSSLLFGSGSAISLTADSGAIAIQESEPAADSCKCLNWKELFASGHVDCHQGLGFEYLTEQLTMDMTTVDMEYIDQMDDGKFFSCKEGRCRNFLEKFDDNFCVNKVFEQPNSEQWCYVSAGCDQLAGGKKVNDFVSAKTCAKSEGIQTTTYEELTALTHKFGITYSPGSTAPGYPQMYIAKFVLPQNEFEAFFAANCDPFKDWAACVRSDWQPPTEPAPAAPPARWQQEWPAYDTCKCMNWKTVYGGIDCHKGRGFEYLTEELSMNTHNMYVIDDMDDTWPYKEGRCRNFLEKFDDNFCVNLVFEIPDHAEQWCYVPAGCGQLGGGHRVNDYVSAKVCEKAESLNASTHDEIKALSDKFGLVFGPGYEKVNGYPFMYFAKYIMEPAKFNTFFAAYCDPVKDAPFCARANGARMAWDAVHGANGTAHMNKHTSGLVATPKGN